MLLSLLLIAADVPDYGPLIAADRRLVEVGRRLAKGGAGLCTGYVSNPGWALADIAQYRPEVRKAVRDDLEIGDAPTIVALLPDSPALRGGLKEGDEVVAVDGRWIGALDRRNANYARLGATEGAVDTQLQSGRVDLRVRRADVARDVTIHGERGCPSRFVVGRARGLRGVSSDGRQVGVSFEMLGYVANDDELALILGHELAHNILGHNKGVPSFRAAGEDRSGRNTKSREVEADRWALYLMARAGYDVSVAPGFWRRWGPKTSFGIFGDGSHPGWRDRAQVAEAEIARIKAQQARGEAPTP